MKILHETIIKDSNNLINLNEIKNCKIEDQNKSKNIINEENDLSYKNNTIENLRKNINTSNIFENISEISKKEHNYIEKGVKTKIFETENTQKNTEIKNQNEIYNENINDDNSPDNRLKKNIFDKTKIKKLNNSNQKVNDDISSKLKFLIYIFLNYKMILKKK